MDVNRAVYKLLNNKLLFVRLVYTRVERTKQYINIKRSFYVDGEKSTIQKKKLKIIKGNL